MMTDKENKVCIFFTGYLITYNSNGLILYLDDIGDLTSNIQRAKIFDEETALIIRNSLLEDGITVAISKLETSYGFTI